MQWSTLFGLFFFCLSLTASTASEIAIQAAIHPTATTAFHAAQATPTKAGSGEPCVLGGRLALSSKGPRAKIPLSFQLPTDLFAQVKSIDPRHIAGGWVVDLAEEPEGGDVIALAQVLMHWLDAYGERIVVTGGSLVLRFSDAGLLLADTYLGPNPDGPPCSDPRCADLPRTLLDERLEPEALALDEAGYISLALWHQGMEDQGKPPRQLSLLRLGPDLKTLPGSRFSHVPTRATPTGGRFKAPSGAPVLPPNTLASIGPLPNTELCGSKVALALPNEGKTVMLTQLELAQDFGMEALFVTFDDPRHFGFRIDAQCVAPGASLVLSLLNRAGRYEVVEVLEQDCADVQVMKNVDIFNPEKYIHDQHNVFIHLEVIYGFGARRPARKLGGRDAVDIDELVIESEP